MEGRAERRRAAQDALQSGQTCKQSSGGGIKTAVETIFVGKDRQYNRCFQLFLERELNVDDNAVVYWDHGQWRGR